MKNNPLPRLDQDNELREKLLPFCRLRPGEIWIDPLNHHKVGCLDAAKAEQLNQLMEGQVAHYRFCTRGTHQNLSAKTCQVFRGTERLPLHGECLDLLSHSFHTGYNHGR